MNPLLVRVLCGIVAAAAVCRGLEYEYQNVQWTGLNNVYASGTAGGIAQTGSASWGSNYGESAATVSRLGDSRVGVRFSGLGPETFIGLACGSETSSDYIYDESTCYFAIYRTPFRMQVREPGFAFQTLTNITSDWGSDVFEIRLRADGRVQWLRNGNVFRTSVDPVPSFPVRVHATLMGGSVGAAQWSVELRPPTGQPTGQPTRQPASGLQRGLKGHFTFNGNANDSSGYGNHGVVHGATLAVDRWGTADGCYSFDGSSSYIEVADGSDFDFIHNFSVSLWVREVGAQVPVANLLSKSHIYPLRGAWVLDATSSGVGYNVVARRQGAWDYATAVQLVADQWAHLVAVNERGMFRMYVDAALASSKEFPDEPIEGNGNAPLHIGAVVDTAGFMRHFRGFIDDVRLYDRALSAQEVTQLYSQDSPTGQPTSYPSADSTATMCDPSERCFWPQQGGGWWRALVRRTRPSLRTLCR